MMTRIEDDNTRNQTCMQEVANLSGRPKKDASDSASKEPAGT
jgi:hypothetical protein